jgi:microsomal dipeptidase-like Zn-dependent dipeptidase
MWPIKARQIGNLGSLGYVMTTRREGAKTDREGDDSEASPLMKRINWLPDRDNWSRHAVAIAIAAAAAFAVLLGLIGLTVSATPSTYSYADYNSTPGYRGWTYWDSLGQQMVWSTSTQRWTCLNPVDQWCYWSQNGGHPGADRNIIRRWTPPSAGSARITGIRQKDSNVCGGTDGPDGVTANGQYRGKAANYYLTYTLPGPAFEPNMGGAVSGSMGCSDTNVYSFDWDAELYLGDALEFSINRRSNYSWDSTTFQPTITFEDADAIGSLETHSTASPTSITVAFDGFLQCPNGATCNYTDTLPPDYYVVSKLNPYPVSPTLSTTLNNYALCGPRDGPFCLNSAPPRFSVAYHNLSPNSVHRFKVRAYRAGHLYGQSKIITLQTGAVTPPTLSPRVTISALNPEFNAKDVIISWQAPSSPLNYPAGFDRFELTRQALSSQPPITTSVFSGSFTGEELCAGVTQSGTAGEKQELTCVSTSSGRPCNVTQSFGSASCVAWDPPVRVGYSKWNNNNTQQLWINTADQASPSRRTDLNDAVVTSVTDPGVDRKPTTYRYFLVARYKPAYASPTERSEMTGKITLPRPATIAGFADAHVHQFGNLAHGGTILDGRSGDTNDGAVTYDDSLRSMGSFFCNMTGAALRGCDAVADGGSGNHDFGALNVLIDLLGVGHSKAGIRNLPEWLTYSNSLHQQVYKTALKRAVDGGLRLMVMHAVNSEFLCKAIAAVRGGGQSLISCNDSLAMDVQITAAYRFQSEVDREANCTVPDVGLPNTNLDNACGWYRIVTTPAAARKAMKNGKLAVVLGIEAATPFDCGTGSSGGIWAGGNVANWNRGGTRPICSVGATTSGAVDILNPGTRNSLQFFYNRGVRHVFPVHGTNNGLGHTAFFNPSGLYAYNQVVLNGTWFRSFDCVDRGAGVDGPMAHRIRPQLVLSLGPFGDFDVGALITPFIGPTVAAPTGFPGGDPKLATCNAGGNFGDGLVAIPPSGLTPLGRAVLQEMMKRRMIIDIDHMSQLTHLDAVAESRKSFNYPLVSGHANLQRISTGSGGDPGSEVALSTPELNEVRASGGQVNLVAVASFATKDIATYNRIGGNAAATVFEPRTSGVVNNCDNSSKAWAQTYLAAVDLTRNAPMPTDNSEQGVYGIGFGSDFNTMMSMLQPRFGFNGDWYGCSGHKAPSGESVQQLAQRKENEEGGVGKAVQYDIDMIDGSTTLRGHGGIDTRLQDQPDLNFPGFSGPRLRRSRLNEGGFLFTLYGPDKPPTSNAQGDPASTKCLDNWGTTNAGDWPRIGNCGDTANYNQQWLYSNNRIAPLRDPTKNLVLQRNPNNTYVLLNQSCTANCEWAVTYEAASTSPRGMWRTLPSGQLFNPESNRCLGVQNHGFSWSNYVVAAPCAGNSFGSPLQPDQMWARGGEEESFNLTGLHHIGMYPDLIQDLKNIGIKPKDLVPLFQSAEGYLQMWERTGWTKAIDYTRLSSDGSWKFTTTAPPAGWQNVAFDDSAWRVVSDDSSTLTPFGSAPWGTGASSFPNPTPARWMPVADGTHTYYFRRTFVSDAIGIPKTVTVSCDDTASVYLDGTLKFTTGPWTTAMSFQFPPSAFRTHVIAISCTNTGGPGGLLVDVR